LKLAAKNKLPQACNRIEAPRQKAVKVASFEHDRIIEEAGWYDRLEYNDNNKESKDVDKESYFESDSK
jgi:hypothetical protein